MAGGAKASASPTNPVAARIGNLILSGVSDSRPSLARLLILDTPNEGLELLLELRAVGLPKPLKV